MKMHSINNYPSPFPKTNPLHNTSYSAQAFKNASLLPIFPNSKPKLDSYSTPKKPTAPASKPSPSKNYTPSLPKPPQKNSTNSSLSKNIMK